jgi:hypothetical protein
MVKRSLRSLTWPLSTSIVGSLTVVKMTHTAMCRMGETVEQIGERALAKAERLGHDMEALASGLNTGFDTCRRCRLSFTIGNVSSSKRTKEQRGVQLIADTALTTPCRTPVAIQ